MNETNEIFTRDQVKKFLGLSEQALQYYIDTERLAADDAGMFRAKQVREMLEGMRLFGIGTAAAYLGMSVQNLKYHIYTGGNIEPVIKGKSLVFSREQLDDFAANGRTDIRPSLSDLYSAREAAEYLGISFYAFGWHVRQRNIAGDIIGRTILYRQDALDEFEDKAILRAAK